MAFTREQRIMNLLSMAQRAGRIVSGSFAVEQSVKTKKAVFLLIAADAADESKKNYKKLAEYYRIPYAEGLDRGKLGRCLGKEYRAAAVLTDAGFAGKLRQLMEESI